MVSDPLDQLQHIEAWQRLRIDPDTVEDVEERTMAALHNAGMVTGARLAITHMQQQHEAYQERLQSMSAIIAALDALYDDRDPDAVYVDRAIRAAVQHAESATMPAANDREGTMGEMSTMTPEGDERIEWDPNDEKSVAKARTKFEDVRNKGGKVYTGVKTEVLKPGSEVTKFDPSLGMLLAVPKLAGHPSAI